jgi:hypothetical protein
LRKGGRNDRPSLNQQFQTHFLDGKFRGWKLLEKFA